MRSSILVRMAAIAALLTLTAAAPGHAAAPRTDMVITGQVTTEASQPLFGANVTIEALSISVGTNEDGMYRIVVPNARRGAQVVIRARSFGYVPHVRSIMIAADTATIDFKLVRDVNRLSQVVVNGVSGATEVTRLPFTVAPAGPGGAAPATAPTHNPDPRVSLRGESYARVKDNTFRSPLEEPLSTFGVDVDRASYAIVRRTISAYRRRPVPDAVRIEELINYFPYDYAQATGRHPFAIQTDVAPAPWAPEHKLVRIGLQARSIDLSKAPANNLVFLIDVSGSMNSPDKLPLLKQAFRMLVEQMREQDRIAVVTYAGSEGLALPSTSGADKSMILEVLGRLEAGGSTAGGAGLRLAYDVAQENFLRGGNNRVILATDGDFNVGVTNNGELEKMIERRREEGTALTVLGFGAGNIHDDRMEMLADKGNGNYAFIDTPFEARKVLVNEMGGTLVTVAKDVKLQVEFNPAVVASYRLIGYENRMLAAEDFRNDRKDAGDLGAGHSVTALYEIVPVSAREGDDMLRPDALRYQRPAAARARTVSAGTRAQEGELMYVRLRYKTPNGTTSVPFEHIVADRVTAASTDFRFAQAVAAFGMSLRDSEHRGSATAEMALELANGALGTDAWGYRRDFVRLVTQYLELGEVARAPGRR